MQVGSAAACTLAVAVVCGGTAAAAADWRDNVTFTLSDRARGGFVDWFDPPRAPRTTARSATRSSPISCAPGCARFSTVQLGVEAQDAPQVLPTTRRWHRQARSDPVRSTS
jgi:hypothetical protein